MPGEWRDATTWWVAREAVDLVRYRPRHLELMLACGAHQPEISPRLARWMADVRVRPAVARALELPHAAVRAIASHAARWFGPTASALVRWVSGAVAAAADRAGAGTLERPLRARIHPGLLVPHAHAVAVVAIDMRGFSALVRTLDDTQYVTELVGDYLTEMTTVVERHRGLVFQYTGDGLLALFLPELAGMSAPALFAHLIEGMAPTLHARFASRYEVWREEWRARGHASAAVGLGVGMSFGPATIGFIGPAGKKQFGVIGEPVNVAVFLCSAAEAGSALIEHDAFGRAGCAPPPAPLLRLRSKKPHQRIAAVCLRYGPERGTRFAWLLPGVRDDD